MPPTLSSRRNRPHSEPRAYILAHGITHPTGGAPVKTMTKEWQEASNEIALEQKQNPITGIASDNYKGKGHVQSA
jgi:hypothetical protein